MVVVQRDRAGPSLITNGYLWVCWRASSRPRLTEA